MSIIKVQAHIGFAAAIKKCFCGDEINGSFGTAKCTCGSKFSTKIIEPDNLAKLAPEINQTLMQIHNADPRSPHDFITNDVWFFINTSNILVAPDTLVLNIILPDQRFVDYYDDATTGRTRAEAIHAEVGHIIARDHHDGIILNIHISAAPI